MLRGNRKQQGKNICQNNDSQQFHSQIQSQNSTSVIQIQEQNQSNEKSAQNSYASIYQYQQIKISPKKTIDFQEQPPQIQMQQIKKKQPVMKKNNTVKPKLQYNEQKKQTVTTTHESGSQIKKRIKRNIIFQEKIQKTQHFSYRGGTTDMQQEGSEQQQENAIQLEFTEQKKRKIQVPKTFVAQNFQDLIFSKIPLSCTVTAVVSYNHEFLSFKRQYNLYLLNQKKYVLSAVKSRIKLSSQFQIKRIINNRQQSPVGFLKSNFTGLEYIVQKVHKNENNRVSEQCWIGYDFNLLGLAHQRNLTILKNSNFKLQKIPYFSQIKNYYENGMPNKFDKFMAKKAIINKFGDYQLDFHGKVPMPSKANFIISDQKDKQCLLFGKRKENVFILEVGFPFSLFEAFAIAVSNLDHKLFVR